MSTIICIYSCLYLLSMVLTMYFRNCTIMLSLLSVLLMLLTSIRLVFMLSLLTCLFGISSRSFICTALVYSKHSGKLSNSSFNSNTLFIIPSIIIISSSSSILLP
eukprot:NODE_282_length_11867_cov_0.266995.p7 type:complete len:105 gc:universal NODE_282_length_11867_cov_0.266995:8375-8061(-)